MPGTPDDWTRVKNPFHRTADAAGAPDGADSTTPTPLHTSTDGPAESASSPASTATRRRRWPFVAGATAVVLLATGAVAYGNARKTVELDVDGQITTVTTFAGSVEGLLAEQEVAVGDRDLVVPDVDAALRGGSDVVVRYGREVPVQVDGSQSSVWLTALDADEALTTLASRGSDVRLVASRSGERASLPIRLDADGPVNVVADGETKVAPDGSIGIDAILDQQGIVLGEHDRVSVARDETADPATELETDLGNLGGFPRSRLTRDHHDLVVADRRGDVVLALGNRQVLGIRDRRDRGGTVGETPAGALDLGGDAGECVLATCAVETAAEAVFVAERHVGERRLQVAAVRGRGDGHAEYTA